MPFYTIFQVIVFNAFENIFVVSLIKYSKDFVLLSSFFLYILGTRKSFYLINYKFSILDKLTEGIVHRDLKAGKGKFLEDLKEKPIDEVLPVLRAKLQEWAVLTHERVTGSSGYHPGQFERASALLDTGDVKCWGGGGAGQLGYASTDSKGDEAGDVESTSQCVHAIDNLPTQQERHQARKKRFSTMLFHLMGDRAIPELFIKHPICGTDQPAAIISTFVNARQTWRDSEACKEARESSEKKDPRKRPSPRKFWLRGKQKRAEEQC